MKLSLSCFLEPSFEILIICCIFQSSLFELDWLRPSMGVMINGSIVWISSLLAQDLSDALSLLVIRFCFFTSIFIDVFVNTCCCSVSKEWLVVEIVVFVVTEA